MIDYKQVGFNQFLRRGSIGESLASSGGLNESSIGASQTLSVGQIFDRLANIPASLITGDLAVRTITAILGTIGGWTISSSALTSANITLDSVHHRILVNDGSNDRVLIGDDS